MQCPGAHVLCVAQVAWLRVAVDTIMNKCQLPAHDPVEVQESLTTQRNRRLEVDQLLTVTALPKKNNLVLYDL